MLDPRFEFLQECEGDLDYTQEIVDALVTLDQIFQGLDEERNGRSLSWSETELDQILARFDFPMKLAEGDFWEIITFLKAATFAPGRPDGWQDHDHRPSLRDGDRMVELHCSGHLVSALQRLKELCQPSKEDILRVLQFKSIFDSLTVEQFRSWNGWEPMEIGAGVEVLHVPYPSYHPAVWQWNEAVYETRFYINPYRGEKPGDPIPHPRFLNIGARGHQTPDEFFADADLDEVRQYMAVCLRGEKWCDGHIAGEFERGVIQAAFQRLEELFSRSRSSADIGSTTPRY